MPEKSSPAIELTPARSRYSLSAKMLLPILALVTFSGVLIHIPSIVDYRQDYLKHRILDAYLATRILQSESAHPLDPRLEQTLLEQAKVLGIELRQPSATVRIGQAPTPAAVFDLRADTPYQRWREALITLLGKGQRIIQLIGTPPGESGVEVAVWLDEHRVYDELYHYSIEALRLSVLISLVTAMLIYLSLQGLMVRAIRRITRNLVQFREDPQNPACAIEPSRRSDEIGVLERELARMQNALRTALAQQSRLAALGRAVSRINHDMKSILSTVSIASERLAKTDDPTIHKIATLLVGSVEKAVDLCTQTQDLARGEQAVPQRTCLRLHDLIDQVGSALGLEQQNDIQWRNEVDVTLTVKADAERLYRVLMNLVRNAVEALAGQGTLQITACRSENQVMIDVRDTGAGIPEPIRVHLFEPFTGSARPGGTGLGLATARDLVRAHGGELTLVETGPQGTCFRIQLPG